MDPLQIRENEVFEALKLLKELRFVIIGGYALNAYSLPRFSVDCDIVLEDGKNLNGLEKMLLGFGYKRVNAGKTGYGGSFNRYEKRLAESFKVSFDILVGQVIDRQTGSSFSAGWIFKNSKIRELKGKTIVEKLKVRIIDIDALFVMKMVSCRSTDMRDLFMLILEVADRDWIKREISMRCNFNDRLGKLKSKIGSKQFRDGLQGIYGLIDNQLFEKSVQAISSLEK